MRLKTFGGLWIEGAGAPAPLGPRRMALLALVAAAGRRGVSRDRIIGILWSDVGEEQARHALAQTLYSLKRDTGRDWVVAGPELRLDPAITSDVGDLQEALVAGDEEAAARLYAGSFLEGFYLPGAQEFERWVEEERARLRAAVAGAVEQVASRADREGDQTAAIRAWTRLTQLDPLSARYAAGRMRALAAAGDRASALAHAREHAATVRRELEADVDPAIRRLVETLKAERPDAGATPAPQPATVPAPPSSPGAAAVEAPRERPDRRAPKPRVRRPVMFTILLGAAGLTALGIAVLSPRGQVVTPIIAVGTIRTPELGDTSSAGLVLRDMLATGLGGLEGLQVVANSRLVELTAPGTEHAASALADAARRAGATEVIEGELVANGDGLLLTLRRVDLGSGMVRGGYTVRTENRYALVDSAAAQIARDLNLAAPSVPVRAVRTASPEAYALYNEGLRTFYSYDAPGAHRLMTAALERDSTFAMAAYFAWQSGPPGEGTPATGRLFERARRLATRTIERERLLIQAQVAGVEAPIAVAAAVVETLAVRYPSDPDGQILLGNVRHGQGNRPAALAAYERAVAIDSTAGATGPFCRMCLALASMGELYLWWDSAGAAERVAHRLRALRLEGPEGWVALVEPLLRQGRRAEAEAALVRSGLMERGAAAHWDAILTRDLIRWGRWEELDRKLRTAVLSLNPYVRGEAAWLLELGLRDQGRLREAMALALEGRIPGTSTRVPNAIPETVLSATLLQELGRPDSAAKLLHQVARNTLGSKGMARGQQARHATWQLTLAGTAYAAAGDTATVRRLADYTEVLARESTFGRDPQLHHYLRGLVLQHAGRHAEAVEELRQSIFSLSDGYTLINLALARSLTALGRFDEAIAVLRPAIRGGVDGSNTYTSRPELHEAMAQAFEQAGQADSAAAHWRAVEQAWRHADPEFSQRYQRARAAAGR